MIGRTISHYTVLEKLGQGGMGVVYKALDTVLNRHLALKFLPAGHAGSESVRRQFLQEARAAATLNHPNVLTVYEIDETDDGQFIAMELIEGKTLAELMREGRIPFADASRYAGQVAAALRAAHDRGVVHRDVTPANIMVTGDGHVKVMDFGLAHIAEGLAPASRTENIAGTLPYMSPEQIEGAEIDHRTDIFSFGVVCYEMFSGQHPFPGAYRAAVLYSILSANPPSLADIDDSIPGEIVLMVDRCMMKSPADRYQSFEELLETPGLQEILAGRSGGPLRPNSMSTPPPSQVFETDHSTFVGRTDQRKRLQEYLSEARTHRGGTVLITGEAGIGKSRLVGDIAAMAYEEGITVVAGRCLAHGGELPYYPFITAIRELFSPQNERAFNALVRRSAAAGIPLAGRAPLLQNFLGFAAEATPILNKEQLWDSILLLLKAVTAGGPMVLILEDLHWADAATGSLFSFIARNIRDLPIVLIGTSRALDRSDGQGAADAAIRDLLLDTTAEQIELHRMSEDETRQIVQATLDGAQVDEAVLRMIWSATEGNPLFTIELINHLRARNIAAFDGTVWSLNHPATEVPIPARVHDVIVQRIERLTPSDRELLEIASCEGDPFHSGTLARCLQRERLPLLKQLQALEREQGMIRSEGRQYRFDHPLVRQLLYEGILPELRVEYHAMIGDYLLEEHGSDDASSAPIARHLVASGRHAMALSFLVRSGKKALEIHAVDEAMMLFHQAADILSRADEAGTGAIVDRPMLTLAVQEGLGDIAALAGKSQEAAKAYTAMLNLATSRGLPAVRVDALRKLAAACRVLGEFERAIASGSEAVEQATLLKDNLRLIESLNALAFVYASQGQYERTIALSQNALAIAQSIQDTRNASVSLSNLGFAHWHRGEYRPAIDRYDEALALQRAIGDRRGLAATLNFAGLAYHRIGQYERALAYHTESLALKRSIADMGALPGSINNIGDIYRDIGDIPRAITYHKESLALARSQNNRGAECDNLRDLGADYLLEGDWEKSRSHLEETLALARQHNYPWYETRSMITLAELACATGDREMAEQFSRQSVESAFALNANELKIEALWVRAKSAARWDDIGKGIGFLRQAIGIAERVGHQVYLWKMYADLAVIEESAGNPSAAGQAKETSSTLAKGLLDQFHDETLKTVFANSARLDTRIG